MRKSLIVVFALIFTLVLSFGVMAENGDDGIFDSVQYEEEYGFFGEEGSYDRFEDDGVAWFNDVDSNNPGQYTNLEGLDRNGYKLDSNRPNATDEDQEVAVKLTVDAYIPCYLELTLTGNQGITSGKSFGPDTNPNVGTANGYLMVFDNEIGGFVDGDWNSKGAGRNAEVEPGDDVYIMACDIFRVDVYGNEDYRYEVEGSALSARDNSGSALTMQMGTSLDLGDTWGTEVDFAATEGTNIFNIHQGGATESMSALHRFRVPYNRNTVHGHYGGTIIFRAVSI